MGRAKMPPAFTRCQTSVTSRIYFVVRFPNPFSYWPLAVQGLLCPRALSLRWPSHGVLGSCQSFLTGPWPMGFRMFPPPSRPPSQSRTHPHIHTPRNHCRSCQIKVSYAYQDILLSLQKIVVVTHPMLMLFVAVWQRNWIYVTTRSVTWERKRSPRHCLN